MSLIQDIGEILIVCDEDEEEENWRVDVTHGTEGGFLDQRFSTPGEAVDAAYKWASDRDLILTFPSMVIRKR